MRDRRRPVVLRGRHARRRSPEDGNAASTAAGSAGKFWRQRRRLRSDARAAKETTCALAKSPTSCRSTVKLALPCFANCSNFYQKPVLLYGPLSGFALKPGLTSADRRTHERPRRHSKISSV